MLILWLMACYTITYYSGGLPLETAEDHEEWHHRFAQGMIEAPGPYDALQHCPNGVRQVQTLVSVENSLASAAANSVSSAVGVDTSGVYTPSTIRVWCKR